MRKILTCARIGQHANTRFLLFRNLKNITEHWNKCSRATQGQHRKLLFKSISNYNNANFIVFNKVNVYILKAPS